MNESNNKLIIFDLDGTLNKTELFAVPAHKKTMKALGFAEVSDEKVINTFGARWSDSVETLIGKCSPEKALEYLDTYRNFETECIAENAAAYDGVLQMLVDLKNLGYKTAVCSNASERYIKMVLDALNLSEHIDYIQPLLPDLTKNETLGLLIQKVKPSSALMVGDRIYDKLAARHNNIPFIGCLYGFDKTEIADADITVLSAKEIVRAIDMLL